MRTWSLARHAGAALVAIVAIYALFTGLPGIFPHPEDFSPWVYLIAFIATLVACVQLPKDTRRWPFWTIALLCLLALLDESGYGVEIFDWKPLYLPQYHVYIRDLHSLADFAVELAREMLDELRWSGAHFASFVLFDVGQLLGAGLFAWVCRRGMTQAKEARWQGRIRAVTITAVAVVGLAAAAALLALPADPKNAILLGYSAIRLGSVFLVLAVSLVPVILNRRSDTKLLDLALAGKAGWVTPALWLIAVAGFGYQLYAPFVFLPDQQVQLARITPLVLWLFAEATTIAMARLLWRGKLRRPLSQVWNDVGLALKNEPSFFYVGIALILIFIAQLIDQDLIPLNQWIVTPGFHVDLWGLWTEETFEMTGAFMFLMAAWLFPRRHQ